MTIAHGHPDQALPEASPPPLCATGERLRPAAARLIAGSARSRAEVDQFVEAASVHGIDLSNLWATFSDRGVAREAALAIPGAGRSAMVFTSNPRTESAAAELARVVRAATAGLDQIVIAQALLLPEERMVVQALELAGWRLMGELAYLRRRFVEADQRIERDPGLPPDLSIQTCGRGLDAELGEALEASYIDTLDCPELCGLRDVADVIESHRAGGRFDPDLWWLVRHHDVPVGAMLFNPNPEQDAIELVYIGLAPAIRGRGLSRALLEFAIAMLCTHGCGEITCAVDLRNVPARRVYESLGFQPFGRRIAMISMLDEHGPAR